MHTLATKPQGTRRSRLHQLPFEKRTLHLLLDARDLHNDTVERNQSPIHSTGQATLHAAEWTAKSSMLPQFHVVIIKTRPTAKGLLAIFFHICP